MMFRNLLLLILAILATRAIWAQNANSRGQILDESTDLPVEGVTVLLDLDTDDEIDYETTTGPFGFYRLEELRAPTSSASSTSRLRTIMEDISPPSGGSNNVVDVTANPAPTDGNGNNIRTVRDTTAIEDDTFGHRFIRLRVSLSGEAD